MKPILIALSILALSACPTNTGHVSFSQVDPNASPSPVGSPSVHFGN